MRTAAFAALGLALCAPALAEVQDYVVGSWRVQPLSPTLVRIEKAGPKGFENRVTFSVVERDWPGVKAVRREKGAWVEVATGNYVVRVPNVTNASGVPEVTTPAGTPLFKYAGVPKMAYLPGPGQKFLSWVMPDSPRAVPPAWGAVPPPEGNTLNPETSGWDVGNNAPDLYVFVTSNYRKLRSDYLRLTGPVPLPPLYTFGLWNSRYHAYTEEEALGVVDTYRQRGFPLDLIVIDTDWRIGASHGYRIDKKYFPDMERFLRRAHEKNVMVMFNDHPEPIVANAVSPKELAYRWGNLTSVLAMGLDAWWFDRNWSTWLREPMPGLRKEVWGMRMYHDMTQRFRPNRRPLIMANVQGVDNGYRNYPSDPAAHRYPIWWTGDTAATWDFLLKGVQNGVDLGVVSLLPYVNEDLGGHAGRPSDELYVRFMQFGMFSPVARPHCTRGDVRYPWEYGPTAEAIVADFTRLRYRLMPTIYAAARRATDDGTPILRRCDLEWPGFKQAADSTQYLFGDDVLVAPVTASRYGADAPIPASLYGAGLKGEYFPNTELTGEPTFTRTDPQLAFDWGTGSPKEGFPDNRFSVRWTGKVGPAPETGEYLLRTTSDDGVRVWFDGKPLIDSWKPQANGIHEARVQLEQGKSYDLRVEFYDLGGEAVCKLSWERPGQAMPESERNVWIPPGQWENAWTGEVVKGPKTVKVAVPLREIPMWVRRGGLVLTAPVMRYTGEKPWSPTIVEAFPAPATSASRELYEDDGISPLYKVGASRRTAVTVSQKGKTVAVSAGPAKGAYAGMTRDRAWLVRVHLLPGQKVASVQLDGKPVKLGTGGPNRVVMPGPARLPMPLMGTGAAPAAKAGPVVQVEAPSRDVAKGFKLTVTLK